MDDINILVIGPSQNGKSTFINKVRQLSKYEAHQEPAAEGDGSKSCTKVCKEYDLLFEKTRYKLVDSETLEEIDVSEEDESHMFGKVWKQRTVDNSFIAPIEKNPQTIRLRIIDTPGLDDSEGSDDRNIAEVMMHLHNLSQSSEGSNCLTAVVFVISTGEPFGTGLQRIYQYYNRCMPALFGGLAVINTNFTVEQWVQSRNKLEQVSKGFRRGGFREGLKEGFKQLTVNPDSARVTVMRERREAFCKTFGQDARHFYVDNAPSDYFLLEELITRNQIYDIVKFLTALNSMPIHNIRLAKSISMIQTDEILASYLKNAKPLLEQREKELMALAGNAERVQASSTKKILRFQNEIEQMEKELGLIDNDTKFTIRTYSTAPLHQLSIPQSYFKWIIRSKISSTLPITEPDHPGFQVQAHDNQPYSRWTGKSWNGDGTAWLGQYEASPGYIPELDAIVSTTNHKYYNKDILRLRRRIWQAKIDIEDAKHIQEYVESQEAVNPVNPELKEIAELIPECDALINQLSLDWDSIASGFDEINRGRYSKGTSGGRESIGLDDLFLFVRSRGYAALERKLRTLQLGN